MRKRQTVFGATIMSAALLLVADAAVAAPLVDRNNIRTVRLVSDLPRISHRFRPVALPAPPKHDSLRKTGKVLTFTGLGIAGLGAVVSLGAAMCGMGSMSFSIMDDGYDDYDDTEPKDCPNALAAGLAMMGLGGALLAIGTTLWVAGAVRSSLEQAGQGREAMRKGWLWAGVGTTITGLAVAGGGAAWIMAQRRDGGTGFGFGASFLLGYGLGTALLVGLPMWIEAWRLRPDNREQATTPTGSTNGHVDRKLRLDPNHESGLSARLAVGHPRATVLSTQFSF